MSPANSGPPPPPPPKAVNNNTAINDEPTNNYDARSEKLETGLEDLLLGPQMHPTFDVFYTLEKKLQGGSYGTVFVGVHNLNEREYAVKVVDRR